MSTSQRTAMVVFAAASALTLSGCLPADLGAVDDGTLKVVTTTTQLTDFARAIGGEDAAVTGLLTPGGSAHHFDPSPADLLALSRADLLVTNGAGLESFIDSAVEASGFTGKIVDASAGIDLEEAEQITAAAEHEGEDAADHAAEHDAEHADAAAHEANQEAEAVGSASQESHDGHDHGAINPHLWTSPRFARGMADEVATAFEQADPPHRSDYAQRAARYDLQLEALDTWIAAQFAHVPAAERVLVSGHDSLRYYLHDYDIAFAGSILPSFEDNAESNAADIDALVRNIRERGVQAIFVESSMSPKQAQTIAREAGIRVIDAENLYADSLGTADSGADTYIAATVHNTRLILKAWGVAPDPLPAELGGQE